MYVFGASRMRLVETGSDLTGRMVEARQDDGRGSDRESPKDFIDLLVILVEVLRKLDHCRVIAVETDDVLFLRLPSSSYRGRLVVDQKPWWSPATEAIWSICVRYHSRRR
jgi:hypothetical protein